MLSATLIALTVSVEIPKRRAIVRIGRSEERSNLMMRWRVSAAVLVPLPQNRTLPRIFMRYSRLLYLPLRGAINLLDQFCQEKQHRLFTLSPAVQLADKTKAVAIYYFPLAFIKYERKSTGTGNTMVVFFSIPISVSVCKYLNCTATG